jgi:preprotein translocase subunit SecA
MVSTPAHDYRRTAHRAPQPPLRGLDAAVHRVFGAYERRTQIRRGLRDEADAVDGLRGEFHDLPDHRLRERLGEFRERFRRGGREAAAFLPPALAAVREAAHRQLGLLPFPVQLMGALTLHRGRLAEMATGEGKTLTAGLAAVLAGWTRRPCHVITVNDYLAARDADWLRPLYAYCGLREGRVTGGMAPADRQQGYEADVTHTTSKELLADFLRDRLRLGGLRDPTRRLIRQLLAPQAAARDGLLLRGLHTAIVDEADSVLIDEAVTPLILSAPRRNDLLREACRQAQTVAQSLEPGADYRVNARHREVELTDAGRARLETLCAGMTGPWRGAARREELVRQALTAREFFHRDKQYVLDGERVVIVDEFTGRPMAQRTWREGLHQAVEAKEGLPVTDPSETVARLSFQRFFRCFHRLSGMTGTAWETAAELWQNYHLAVVRIPPNRPCVRQHWPDRLFADEAAKWRAVEDEVARLHATGRPVLVGTRSVAASERLGERLRVRGLDCQVLNAVRLDEEALIVALAGERGRITIATNMAGRGTDIRLGAGVAALGGLHVLATERHESHRVDRQLFGRSGRQGDPGSAQAFVSAEDELLRRHLPAAAQAALRRAIGANLPAGERLARAALAFAQQRAERQAARQRLAVLRADAWMDEALSFAGEGEV